MGVAGLWTILDAVALLGLTSAAGCASPEFPERPNIYYADRDEPYVLCAANLDRKYDVTSAQIDRALDHAIRDGHTVHLYTHDPGNSVTLSTIEHLLTVAEARGVPLETYDEIDNDGPDHGGRLALSFDDDFVDDWMAMRPMLARHGAHVTFFVTRYLEMSDVGHADLHDLAADGHEIAYHTVSHQDAVKYVEANGMDAYLADEIMPALTAMRADGFEAVNFAYPFGSRNSDLDEALQPFFHHVRAITSTCPRH